MEYDDITHLPDKYDLGSDLIPSKFKLDDAIRSKMDNPLIEYEKADAEETAANPDVVALDNDFDLARENIKDTIKTANTALTEALTLAQAADSPRGFEVVATILKTVAEMNKDLLEIHTMREVTRRKRADRLGLAGADQNVTNQQNNYYISSPMDIIEKLREQK